MFTLLAGGLISEHRVGIHSTSEVSWFGSRQPLAVGGAGVKQSYGHSHTVVNSCRWVSSVRRLGAEKRPTHDDKGYCVLPLLVKH